MNRKQKSRYLLAVYLVVTVIAILLSYVAFNRTTDTWQAMLLNLATELLGVVFVFFLVNYFFLIDDWSLSEQVQALIARLSMNQTPSARDFFLAEPHLSDQDFAAAQTIYLSGFTLYRTTREYISVLTERLQDGAQLRVMVVDLDSEGMIEQIVAMSLASSPDQWRSTIRTTQNFLNAAAQNPENLGQIEVGYLPFAPSFGLQLFDPDEPQGYGYVEIYHHKTVERNATFRLSAADDPEWYSFFRQQYDLLWQSCRVERLGNVSE